MCEEIQWGEKRFDRVCSVQLPSRMAARKMFGWHVSKSKVDHKASGAAYIRRDPLDFLAVRNKEYCAV